MYEKYAAKQREIVVKLLEEELNYTDFNSGRELKINMGAKKPQTNADRIRAMSDEELAFMLANEIPHDCHNCHLVCATYEEDKFDGSCQNAFYRWLQQPAEGE